MTVYRFYAPVLTHSSKKGDQKMVLSIDNLISQTCNHPLDFACQPLEG